MDEIANAPSNEAVIEAKREYQREWRARQDPEEQKKKRKEYYEKNRDKIKQWRENYWKKIAEKKQALQGQPARDDKNNNSEHKK